MVPQRVFYDYFKRMNIIEHYISSMKGRLSNDIRSFFTHKTIMEENQGCEQ